LSRRSSSDRRRTCPELYRAFTDLYRKPVALRCPAWFASGAILHSAAAYSYGLSFLLLAAAPFLLEPEETPPPTTGTALLALSGLSGIGPRLLLLSPTEVLGGRRLRGSSRFWHSRGFKLGDPLGEGHDDRVLAAGFVLPVFYLPV
jgi:hypothetical protein